MRKIFLSAVCLYLLGTRCAFSQDAVYSVNSLADLKALTPTIANMIKTAITRCRTSSADGGGGIFVWSSTSTAVADDILTVAANGNLGPGRWTRRHEGYVYPSWFGAQGVGDDHDAIQAAFDYGKPVHFDRSYYTGSPVEIGGVGGYVDFKGYTLVGLSSTAQDAVLWITGRNLTLRNIAVDGNFKPYNTGVHWMSRSAGAPAQYNRIYGMLITNVQTGLLFGGYLYVPNPLDAPQSENFIYGLMFRAVNNCIQMNQPNGWLSIVGGNIDCNPYEWNSNFDLSGSRCYNVKVGSLNISNCELLKTTTTLGHTFEGPAQLTGCTIESAANWFLNPGTTTISGLNGYMVSNDSGSYITLAAGATGQCVISNCNLLRSPGISGYSGQFMINAPSAPDYRVVISDSTFVEWKQGYLTNGDAKISISKSTFPTDPVASQKDCELRYPTGCLVKSGAGSPEGVVSAPVGSLYLRSNGSVNTTFYVKQSGASNVGWVAK